MKAIVIGQLPEVALIEEVALIDIAAPVGERVEEGNRVAVRIVFGTSGFDISYRIGGVDPIAPESQIADRYAAEVVSRETLIIIEGFRTRDDCAILILD